MTVRLKIAADEGEAEVVCGLLRSEGIRCFHRLTNVSAEGLALAAGSWREILVNEEDFTLARELVDAAAEPVDVCVRCGRDVDAEGGWFPDEAGDLHPYCGVCAERLFGPYGLAS